MVVDMFISINNRRQTLVFALIPKTGVGLPKTGVSVYFVESSLNFASRFFFKKNKNKQQNNIF